jgi:hypothetical protein
MGIRKIVFWSIISGVSGRERRPQITFLKGGNMPADVGDIAPDFTLPSVSQGDISLGQYRGNKNVVLSFHVFDFTSG